MRPGGWTSPTGLLLAPLGIPWIRPAGRGPGTGALPPRASRPARRPPPGSPAAVSAISLGHSPLRVSRGPLRERAGATRGGLGAWASTPAGPPRSPAKLRAVLSAPRRWAAAALSAGRAGGGLRLPSVGRRHTLVRTGGQRYRRHEGASGIRHSELSKLHRVFVWKRLTRARRRPRERGGPRLEVAHAA